MDSTTFTAYTLDGHRAAQLNRENEIRRSQREHREARDAGSTARTGWFARLLHPRARRATHRIASAH